MDVIWIVANTAVDLAGGIAFYRYMKKQFDALDRKFDEFERKWAERDAARLASRRSLPSGVL